MATTGILGLIIPDENTPASINATVAALGGSVDAKVGPYVTDTGWISIEIKAPYVQQGSTFPQVRRIGKTVHMRWGWASTSMSTNGTHEVGTVPAGFRPSQTAYVPASSSGYAQGAGTRGIFYADGKIQLTTANVLGGYYIFNTSWLVD